MINEGVPWFGRMAGDPDWTAVIRLPVEPAVKTLPEGLVLQATIDRRAEVREVRWNGAELASNHWQTWRDGIGIVVRAEIHAPPPKQENRLEIRYSVPFKRHVEFQPKAG